MCITSRRENDDRECGAHLNNKAYNGGGVLNWLCGIFFILAGIGALSMSTTSSVVMMAIGLMLMPPICRFMHQKQNLKMTPASKVFASLIGIVIVGVISMPTTNSTASANQKTQAGPFTNVTVAQKEMSAKDVLKWNQDVESGKKITSPKTTPKKPPASTLDPSPEDRLTIIQAIKQCIKPDRQTYSWSAAKVVRYRDGYFVGLKDSGGGLTNLWYFHAIRNECFYNDGVARRFSLPGVRSSADIGIRLLKGWEFTGK